MASEFSAFRYVSDKIASTRTTAARSTRRLSVDVRESSSLGCDCDLRRVHGVIGQAVPQQGRFLRVSSPVLPSFFSHCGLPVRGILLVHGRGADGRRRVRPHVHSDPVLMSSSRGTSSPGGKKSKTWRNP